VHPYGHFFVLFSFVFLITLPVLKLTAENLAQVFIFIGILLFHRHFLKKKQTFFALGTKNTPSQHLLDTNVPIKTAIFNPRFS